METPNTESVSATEGDGEQATVPPRSLESPTELEAFLREAVPEVERVLFRPSAFGPGAFIAVVRLARSASKKEPWARRITELFAREGVTVVPAVYTSSQWSDLDRSVFGSEWPSALQDDGQALSVVELVTLHGSMPRDLRRLLLREIAASKRFLTHLRAYTPLPLHQRLSLCAEVHRRSLDRLFATRGRIFRPDAASIAEFDRLFVDGGRFERSHVLDYFEMVALSSQAELSHHVRKGRSFRRRSLQLFDGALRFLAVFRRVALDEHSTQAERRRRRVLKLVAAALAVMAGAAGIAIYLRMTQPEAPIADERVITRPGGLLGTYFKGKAFDHQVLRKIDGSINFRSRKTWVKGVPANDFSVRWTGYIQFPDETPKLLWSRHDDAAKVYFNHRLIIDDWKPAGARTRCRRIRPKKGWYPLKVEYYDTVGWAEARLRWCEAQDRLTHVPGKHLCCR